MSAPLLDALAQALRADPTNGPLWLHYAELLLANARDAEGLVALRQALAVPAVELEATRKLVAALRERGQYAEALIRAESALAKREDAALRAELALVESLRSRDAATSSAPNPTSTPTPAPPPAERPLAPPAAVEPENVAPEDWAAQFDWGDLRLTLADVVGLEEAKRQIRLRILAPFKNPQIYEAYRREGGGGILLYGPPGCGKTFLARATAGELGARFVSVSIHDVLDKYWGESEKLVHKLFEHARSKRPTLLFFDEFDALGAARKGDSSSFLRSVVDQVLQEMDGIGGRNRDVLVVGATNTPWNVDSAFRRPGRFDRVLFVPPPDEPARLALLQRHLAQSPGGAKLDLRTIAKRTDLFSAADVRALCERAAEGPLERALEDGVLRELSPSDVEAAFAASRSSIREWFASAKNYVRFANQGGQYDDLAAFLARAKL